MPSYTSTLRRASAHLVIFIIVIELMSSENKIELDFYLKIQIAKQQRHNVSLLYVIMSIRQEENDGYG